MLFATAVTKTHIMTIEQIEKVIGHIPEDFNHPTKIFFKTRNTVEGVFIRTADYSELKGKNFWRIVTVKHIEDYRKSKDTNLSRIFNGTEFVKLAHEKKS